MRAASFSLAYFLVAQLTAHVGFVHDGVPLIALATGIAFSAVQRLGPRAAAPVAVAGLADALVAGHSLSSSVLAGAAAAGSALAGWGVTRTLHADPRGEQIGDTLVRLAASTAAAFVAATGALLVTRSSHADTWAVLLLSNFAGILVAAPAIRTWIQRLSYGVAGWTERVALLAAAVAVATMVCTGAVGTRGPSAYMLFPIVVWSALRAGRMGTSAVVLVVALVAAENVSDGRGPFVDSSYLQTVVSLDSFLVVFSLTGLLLAGLEQARRRTEGRHSRLLDQMPLVTYVRPLDPDQPPRYLSPQAEPLLGYPLSDWFEDPRFSAKIIHPEDGAILEDVNERARTEGLATGEYRMLAADGRVVWILDHQAPIRNDAGEHVGVQGFVIDISERKLLEAQLARAERLESLGLLAGGIAHDFNNLLTAISGYTQLALEQGGKDDDHLSRPLREVQIASDRAAKLTRQLLAFGRRQVLDYTTVDLNAVVADSRALLARLIGETIEVRAELEREPACVRADEAQLGQVVMNLAVNARDAMPDGGTLTIRTSIVGDRVALEVADTGIGMDAATRAKVFEPFFTTKEIGAGTGLGLSVVDGIVQQCGGEIAVESEPGKGTVFRIWLPRVDVLPEPAAVPAPARLAGSETVLLVEDEAIVRRLTTEMLERSGYRVVAADGPEAALAVDEPYDLLLTDVVMPSMNGPELAKRLDAKRVLFTSGYSGSAIADWSEVDADLLEKPFTIDELSRKVREALDARAAR